MAMNMKEGDWRVVITELADGIHTGLNDRVIGNAFKIAGVMTFRDTGYTLKQTLTISVYDKGPLGR